MARDANPLRKQPARHPMTRGLLGLATLLLAGQSHAWAGAIATSYLVNLDLTFSLASSDESVSVGVPTGFCIPIGNGSCANTIFKDNWLGKTAYGPTPIGKDLHIFENGVGGAEAFSPPSAFSWYVEGGGQFFDFTNLSDQYVDVEVSWNIAYELSTSGVFSAASISAFYAETDITHGITLIPPDTNWNGFTPVSVQNGGEVTSAQLGGFVVSIDPKSTTELHIGVTMGALAVHVADTPDPSSLLLSGPGLVGLLGYGRLRWKRRSNHRPRSA